MTVCYFGYYKKNYSRNRNIILALRRKGVEVLECQSPLPFGKFRYISLVKQYLSAGLAASIIIVGFPGHTDVFLAYLFAKIFRKKLIFDPFISLYNTVVDDRKTVSKDSLSAKYYFWLDKLSCALSDVVLMDTDPQIKYFVKTFSLPVKKFVRVQISADEVLFHKSREAVKKNNELVVGFHGNYLPLQGVEYIIKAAEILKKSNIQFNLLGNGIGRKKCEELSKKLNIKNINFFDSVPYEQLPRFIQNSDIYLGGPFENNLKSQLVIPNKVVEAIAIGKPVIVGRTDAMEKDFQHLLNCYMVNLSSEFQIAAAIKKLEANPLLRRKIGDNGLSLYKKKFSLDIIGDRLLKYLRVINLCVV